MAGLVGLTKLGENDSVNVLLEIMINECTSKFAENELIKIQLSNVDIALVLPKGKAISKVEVDDIKQRAIIVYGYCLPSIEFATTLPWTNIAETDFNNTLLGKKLSDLDGSFVIIIVEPKKIYIITDRFGTRPIYYAMVNDKLVFSSCLRSIVSCLKHLKIPIEINEEALVSYLWFGKAGVIDNDTLIKGVYLIPPASIITFDINERKIKKTRYWSMKFARTPISKQKKALELLYTGYVKAVIKAIKVILKELHKDAKICLQLSGGMDSRALAGIIAKLKELNSCAVIVEHGVCDEVIIAGSIAKHLQLNHIINL